MAQLKIVEEEEPVKTERKVGPNPYNRALDEAANALEEAEEKILFSIDLILENSFKLKIHPRGSEPIDRASLSIKEAVSVVLCMEIDRLREAAEEWKQSCESSYHDLLKRDDKEWDENVEPIGLQETMQGTVELGNCYHCASTISRPVKEKKDFEWAQKRITEVREWMESNPDLLMNLAVGLSFIRLQIVEHDLLSVIDIESRIGK